MLCAQKLRSKWRHSRLTIPTTFSFGNTNFLWTFFPLFLWASCLSALFSDRRTSKPHAQHAPKPVQSTFVFLCLKPQGLSWETHLKGCWYYSLQEQGLPWPKLSREYCFSLHLCSLSVEYPDSGRHFLENSIHLSWACQLFALGARHGCEATTHMQFRCFTLRPVHTGSQLRKSTCDCCCCWFLHNPFLCSSISWALCKCSADPRQGLPCHLCWGCKLSPVAAAKIEGGSCI